MATKLGVYNEAALILKQRPVASLSEQTPTRVIFDQAWAPTLEYTVHFPRELPAPGNDASDWYLVRLSADMAEDGHFSEDGELWSQDGKLLARCRQMALLRNMKAEEKTG